MARLDNLENPDETPCPSQIPTQLEGESLGVEVAPTSVDDELADATPQGDNDTQVDTGMSDGIVAMNVEYCGEHVDIVAHSHAQDASAMQAVDTEPEPVSTQLESVPGESGRVVGSQARMPAAPHEHPALLFAERGAASAATNVLLIAQRAAGASNPDARMAMIRGHSWSKLHVPLLWAAADDDDHHPVLEWLERAAHGCQLVVHAIGNEAIAGPTAVHEAWSALRAGMRSLGIGSRHALVNWLAQNGYGRVVPGGYLAAMAQVALIGESHAALHGTLDDCVPPAIEEVYVGIVAHLAGRADLSQLVADAQ
eukprot:12411539-Karenia_brevis.AAC.1